MVQSQVRLSHASHVTCYCTGSCVEVVDKHMTISYSTDSCVEVVYRCRYFFLFLVYSFWNVFCLIL